LSHLEAVAAIIRDYLPMANPDTVDEMSKKILKALLVSPEAAAKSEPYMGHR
jgi:hypothetical protein